MSTWFKKTLQSGEWGEDMIAEHLKANGYNIVSFHKGSEYDILIEKNNKEIWIEVKTDFSYHGGTVNIEYESNGIPSGISKTEAEYYFLFQPKLDELIIVRVDKLKEAIKKEKYNKIHSIGSNGELAMMYHFDKAELPYTEKDIEYIDWRKNKHKSTYPLPQKL